MSKILFSSIIIIGFLLTGNSQGNTLFEEGNTMAILEKIKNSFGWTDSFSMKAEIETTPKGIPDKQQYKTIIAIHKHLDHLKLDGNIFISDVNGQPVSKTNSILRIIITDKEYVNIVGIPDRPPLGASITTEFKEGKEVLLESDNCGGPLFARISGTNHKSVVDLISESNDIYIRQEQENVNGINCYALEGKTKYGKVTAWIAPDKGYAAIKWKLEKTGDDFVNDTPMSETKILSWNAQFEVQEIQQIGASFIPKTATFSFSPKLKDGSSISILDIYKISDVQLNPDFETLGTFRIDLPEGTKITIPESPGVKYVWKDGKAVPDVDSTTFDEIDKTIDQIKQQQ